MKNLIRKIKKTIFLLPVKLYRMGLIRGVAAAVEHEKFLKNNKFNTVIDIGANKGQFALVARKCFPESKIISFDPLPNTGKIFNTIFKDDINTIFHNYAIGPDKGKNKIHISLKDDSSSLLGITELQDKLFPGTAEKSMSTIDIAPLDFFLEENQIKSPGLLKLDVQGFEYEALLGCDTLLDSFDSIYCECSFVELYKGQRLVDSIISLLQNKGFILKGFYNTSYDQNNIAIQSDFFFKKIS
jgi:FkbM family methyltransferase